ncbi:hypothetical protein D6779_07665 [Candidatus Parcubacteria bacterium]|nr:MAG: hypothetical protein D6779_07665 [Candidatus Parcubacteria bacterium]
MRRGQITLQILIFTVLAAIVLGGLALWANVFLEISLRVHHRQLAFNIAEAGIEYYRWHLAHAPQDYQDGTGGPDQGPGATYGPFEHNYYDKEGNKIGTFTLYITAPPIGSNVVKIRSIGKIDADSAIQKIIEVKMGIASLAKYVVVANDVMRFGEGTEVFGEIHSNKGIRFDGLAHNLVKSAVAQYDDPDHSGPEEFGVHTHVDPVDPYPPNPVPSRTDVFEAGREFPVPAIDFEGITATLASLKTQAQGGGVYLGKSGKKGYHIVLKTDGTFDVYKVKHTSKPPKKCKNELHQDKWGTWSIQQPGGSGGGGGEGSEGGEGHEGRGEGEQFLQNYPFPANGIVFVEDNVWVDGQLSNARLTIASARFPYDPKKVTHITVNHNLTYTSYDGSAVLGLIAQGNINVGMESDDVLRIDAAVVAQNGRVGRYYYAPPSGNKQKCSPYHTRTKITIYGMIATNRRYGFSYTDGTGYATRELIYDSHLLYNPPPGFPLAGNEYVQLSWDEVQ